MLTKTKPLGDVVRNCWRCGREFRIVEQERVCQACRKPRLKNAERRYGHLALREKQIVDLVTQAKLNREIAHDLHLSEGTIKEYLNKVFRKLRVRNRMELAVWSFGHQAECSLTPSRNQLEPVGLSKPDARVSSPPNN